MPGAQARSASASPPRCRPGPPAAGARLTGAVQAPDRPDESNPLISFDLPEADQRNGGAIARRSGRTGDEMPQKPPHRPWARVLTDRARMFFICSHGTRRILVDRFVEGEPLAGRAAAKEGRFGRGVRQHRQQPDRQCSCRPCRSKCACRPCRRGPPCRFARVAHRRGALRPMPPCRAAAAEAARRVRGAPTVDAGRTAARRPDAAGGNPRTLRLQRMRQPRRQRDRGRGGGTECVRSRRYLIWARV